MSTQKAKTQQNKHSQLLFPANLEAPEHHDRKKDAEDVNKDRECCYRLSHGSETDCNLHTALRLVDLSDHIW